MDWSVFDDSLAELAVTIVAVILIPAIIRWFQKMGVDITEADRNEINLTAENIIKDFASRNYTREELIKRGVDELFDRIGKTGVRRQLSPQRAVKILNAKAHDVLGPPDLY